MKKKKEVKIQINLSNKLVYTLIVFGILAIVAVGLYAYGTNSPSNMGHSLGELSLPSCSDGQVLGKSGGEWGCVDIDAGGSETEVCPEGFEIDYNYVSGNDVYGNWISAFGYGTRTDTCNGNIQTEYTCPLDAIKTCRDFRYTSNYYYRDITCVSEASVICKSA